MTIEAAISRSNKVVCDLVWPTIKPLVCDLLAVPDLEIIAAETEGSSMAQTLDMNAGVDILLRDPRRQAVWTVATRVQYSGDYQSFTIRSRTGWGNSRTELLKRAEAIASDSTYPQLTLQAYTAGGSRLLSAAIIATRSLYNYVGHPEAYTRTNHVDGSQFLIIDWSLIHPSHIRIATPTREEMQ